MEQKTILIATDGSPAARSAVLVAVELAAALQARPMFLHASSPLAEALYAEYPLAGPPLDELLVRDSVLADAVDRAREAGLEAEAELIADTGHSADLASTIAGIALGSAASMIVVGSRGRSSVSGAVLGSVSHNLIKYATLPILVVHAAVEDEAAVAGDLTP